MGRRHQAPDLLSFETVLGQGEIARIWNEYLQDAIERVNDKNARKMVLYLAKHEPEEKTRRQIREDLGLTMTEAKLEKRLKQLVMADILVLDAAKLATSKRLSQPRIGDVDQAMKLVGPL